MGTIDVRAANELLGDLSQADYRQVRPYLTAINLSFADVLGKRNITAEHVYFPTSGLISIHTITVGRVSVALVGHEGMTGSAVAAGIEAPRALIVVQGEGVALRMDARRFQILAYQSISLQRHVHRYTHHLLRHASRMAVCNSYHSVETRLARCLLEASDQGGSNEIRITQQLLAYMIAARRPGVSVAAASMRRRKLIDYTRGRLVIISRKGLKRLTCGCYESVTKH